MGQAFLFNDGRRLVPAPSEGGHADFAARTPRQWELVEWLTAKTAEPKSRWSSRGSA
jgi:glucokinase